MLGRTLKGIAGILEQPHGGVEALVVKLFKVERMWCVNSKVRLFTFTAVFGVNGLQRDARTKRVGPQRLLFQAPTRVHVITLVVLTATVKERATSFSL